MDSPTDLSHGPFQSIYPRHARWAISKSFFQKLADLGAPLQLEHWAVHIAFSLQFTEHGTHVSAFDPVPYLQTAWKAVRHQYPAIGSVIRAPDHLEGESDAPTRGLLTIPVCDIDAWNKETFFVHLNEVDADALFCGLRPAPTATCHCLPKSSEILIRSSHWRLDGVGIAKLGHVFLDFLAEALSESFKDDLPASTTKLPSSIQSLPPSVEEIARIWSEKQSKIRGHSMEESRAQSHHLESGANALVGEFLRGVPSIGLPTRADSIDEVPGPSARVSTQLSVPITTRIMEAQPSKNLSFMGAVHAAIVRVTASFPQHPLSKSYAAFFPVDLRHSITSSGAASEDQLMFGLY
ncbi:hypothetical protein M406DRAFT_75237 [Cryphonectria parasitica EP155]|uniref:Uncharacterized protein n=1 Tax=Cryphonectria parasitica (strain ATCC 38755 / EP155) TaxID=660469 RepID=A0A9P5CN74_CRYP1|nr:uncharacterized protein M406DRAFT_75237 [Cryphonectria parasitica EP155]KAF3764012.1 hypothetical protein M406DRAFT_75237 [Cryphonectria parasitica EP155]